MRRASVVLLVFSILAGLGALSSSASGLSHDAALAHASKKKTCKKKSGGGAGDSYASFAKKKHKKKKCKPPVVHPHAFVTINCPTGSVSGSQPVTVSGAALATNQPLDLTYTSVQPFYSGGGLNAAPTNTTVTVAPNSTWSFTFTPGTPPPEWYTRQYTETVNVANGWAGEMFYDETAQCQWTVTD